MPFWEPIAQLVKDPPPGHVFEISEAGIAYARGDSAGFVPFEPGTLAVSPAENNIQRADALTSVLERISSFPGQNDGSKKARRAAMILPDYAARVSVIDFDSFPSSPEEQLSLVRFRLKKTLPFDIDSAAVSYFAQPIDKSRDKANAKGGKLEVVAAAVALEIIARYEALFRAANYHPGEVTTSSLAVLNLYHGTGVAVIAKLARRVLTVMVMADQVLKLFRCVEMERATEEEILLVLYPTLAYVEDELGTRADRLILCGFNEGALAGLDLKTEMLESRLGDLDAYNAGLLGYLEGMQG